MRDTSAISWADEMGPDDYNRLGGWFDRALSYARATRISDRRPNHRIANGRPERRLVISRVAMEGRSVGVAVPHAQAHR